MSLPIYPPSRQTRTRKATSFYLNDNNVQSSTRKRKRPNTQNLEETFLKELFREAPAFQNLGKDKVKKFFMNKHEMAYSRSIMGDFITLLQKEGLNPENKEKNDLSSTIKQDCMNNFQNGDHKCFCCGEDIQFTEKDGLKIPTGVA